MFRRNPERWFSNNEVATQAMVAKVTARLATRTLAEGGLVEVMRLSPAFRYRAKATTCEGNEQLRRQLDDACAVMEIS